MVALGHSPSYRGDPFLVANRSANIPHALNCSVFIVNLPATLTVHRLIIALHGMGPLGRVFAIHINAPEHARGHHGCAAKVVFFERDAAHHFMLLCRQRGFFVDGQQAHVMWNRVKTAENPTLVHSDASRVLLIGGPPAFVNPRTLTEFFKTKLDFQVDEIITRIYGGASGTSVLEYRFGSYRCQAQAAKMALDREFPHIQCFFTADPLESGVWNALEYHKFPKALPVP
ncbi:hypothetical protein M406DRAFT_328246 [Cryphonectria parasitica EP155]|uniref:Uncharacterized protein n=1 Tax=Cryphonectria parasitica (strain ATCC 38755 / EP155) TaxID=660469 RepID=A0A9P5CR43_CRYP1|nr:uncharacterized protein M406DRAFT_328246 [Cryphonectria parasitica EP155]KAF3767147.1 hypothetical protein M406DRAFT_328246 [Cryphonectria parasitica EP155]